MQKTFELVSQDRESKARRGRLITTHGVIDTPVFMPIGTPIAVVTKEYFMSELVFFLRLRVSNALSGKNRGKIFPGRRREPNVLMDWIVAHNVVWPEIVSLGVTLPFWSYNVR